MDEEDLKMIEIQDLDSTILMENKSDEDQF